jgi:hypothetical protein
LNNNPCIILHVIFIFFFAILIFSVVLSFLFIVVFFVRLFRVLRKWLLLGEGAFTVEVIVVIF